LCTRNSTINLTMADKRTGKVNSEKPPIDDAQQKTRQTPLGTSTGWSKPEGDLQRRIVPEARLEVERNRREPGFIAKPGSCIRAFRRAIKPGSTTESGRRPSDTACCMHSSRPFDRIGSIPRFHDNRVASAGNLRSK
jgi:hypothetical protein